MNDFGVNGKDALTYDKHVCKEAAGRSANEKSSQSVKLVHRVERLKHVKSMLKVSIQEVQANLLWFQKI